MTPKFSIIIPVYNAEEYLGRCMDSILVQSFNNFEVLLIDDGSKDHSGAICDEYGKQDERVKVLHKVNGGVSSARNLGLDHVRGEWVTFVDADDYISSDYFNGIQNEAYDLIIGQSKNFDASGKCWNVDKLPVGCVSGKIQRQTFLSKHLVAQIMRTPWGKFFRRSLMAGLRFDEKLQIGEDTTFVFQYLSRCKTILVVDTFVYYYFSNNALLSSKYSMSSEEALCHLKIIVGQYKKLNIKCIGFEKFIFDFMFCLCKDNMRTNIWFRDKNIKDLIRSFKSLLTQKQYLKFRLMRHNLLFKYLISH